jgi:hypothetical protein
MKIIKRLIFFNFYLICFLVILLYKKIDFISLNIKILNLFYFNLI